MSLRRQSMRFSSETSTVTMTKKSVSSVTTSSPFSGSKKSNFFSSESSFSNLRSPEWISGSDVVFKSPKIGDLTRRSTIHQTKRKGNDMDFKIPSLMFSSPPGVKTRSRRSSMYVSSQQKKAGSKVQNQQKEKATGKRVGKTSKAMSKNSPISHVSVSLHNISLVSEAKGGKSKLASKVKSSPNKSSKARNTRSSSSQNKSLEVSKSSSQKSPAKVSPKKGKTRTASSPVGKLDTSLVVTTSTVTKGKKESLSRKSLLHSEEKTSNVKVTPSPPKKGKSSVLHSPKTKSAERKFSRLTGSTPSSEKSHARAASPKRKGISLTAKSSSVKGKKRSISRKSLSQSVERTPDMKVTSPPQSERKMSPPKSSSSVKAKSVKRKSSQLIESSTPPEKKSKVTSSPQRSGTSPKAKSPSATSIVRKGQKRSSFRKSIEKSVEETSDFEIISPPIRKEKSHTPKSPPLKKTKSSKRKSSRLAASIPSSEKSQTVAASSKQKRKSPTAKSPPVTPVVTKGKRKSMTRTSTSQSKEKTSDSKVTSLFQAKGKVSPQKSPPSQKSKSVKRKSSRLSESAHTPEKRQKVASSPQRKGKSPTAKSSSQRSASVRRKSSRLTESDSTPSFEERQTSSKSEKKNVTSETDVITSDFHQHTSSRQTKKRSPTPKSNRRMSEKPSRTKKSTRISKRQAKKRLNVSNDEVSPDAPGTSLSITFSRTKKSDLSPMTPNRKVKTVLKTSNKKQNIQEKLNKSLNVNSPKTPRSKSVKKTPSRKVKTMQQSLQEVQASSSKTPEKSKSFSVTPTTSKSSNSASKGKSQKQAASSQSKQKHISDVKQKSPQILTRKSPKSVSIVRKSLRSPEIKETPSKTSQKSFTMKYSQLEKDSTPKNTFNQRGKITSFSSQKSSKSMTKSSAASSFVEKVEKEISSPYLSVTSRPSRTKNLIETSEATTRSNRGRISVSGDLSSPYKDTYKPFSLLRHHDPMPKSSLFEETGSSSISMRMTDLLSPTIKSKDINVRGSNRETIEVSKSHVSSRVTEHISSPSLRNISHDKNLLISSRKSLSAADSSSTVTSRRFSPSDDFTKTFDTRQSQKNYEDSWKSLSHSPFKRKRFETETEEIDRMVNAMISVGSEKKRKSPSPARNVAKASPARTAILKEAFDKQIASPVTTLTGRSSLRVTRNITPSAAAPKARKVLGVWDTPSTNIEVSRSQTYKDSEQLESSSILMRQSDVSHKTRSIGNKLDDDEHYDEDERTTGSDEDDGYLEEGSEDTKQESASGTGTESEEVIDIHEDEDEDLTNSEVTSETDEDTFYDRDVTLSHTTHSQKCIIS